MSRKTAVIIGAGPAGLTAAYELLEKTNIKPFVYEMSPNVGGLAKTINYKGNRIDIGGHRFFSKSDRVMRWWLNILPSQGAPSIDDILPNKSISLSEVAGPPDPERDDRVMLIRHRLSRILFRGKFFDYPITPSFSLVKDLGVACSSRILLSYLKSRLFPVADETSLEDFFVNRFGYELYSIFFKDYTEKVWGIPCNKIKSEWGAQRVKGLSISKALIHGVRSAFTRNESIAQKDVETTLIHQFLYPKYGPGQLWEEVAQQIKLRGGQVFLRHEVVKLHLDLDKKRIIKLEIKDIPNAKLVCFEPDYVFSTMPVRELIEAITPNVPSHVLRVARGLQYRDFIIVGVLTNELRLRNTIPGKSSTTNQLRDNWIYVQERDVKLGRIQIFNNWSPYLVSDPDKTWLGLEYFCNEGDRLWSMTDDVLTNFAISELEKLGFVKRKDVVDVTGIRVQKAYPAYFGSYDKFSVIKDFVNCIDNLFLIGRNGMHRYNNMDHSMLSAMVAVENIINNVTSKENIWNVNTEQQYNEEIQKYS